MNKEYYEDGYVRRWGLGPPSSDQLVEAARFLSLAGSTEHPYALDLGCGHGRYAVGLARAGGRVVGVDASTSLLQRAVTIAADSVQPIRFVRADMRALPLNCVFTFMLIVDAFGYFDADDEGAQVIREIHRLLRPGGHLVMRNPNGTWIREHFKARDEERRGGVRTIIRRTLERSGRMLREHLSIDDGAGVREFEREAWIYSAAELEDLLSAAGLMVDRHLSDPSGEPFDARTSPRMVTVALKVP